MVIKTELCSISCLLRTDISASYSKYRDAFEEMRTWVAKRSGFKLTRVICPLELAVRFLDQVWPRVYSFTISALTYRTLRKNSLMRIDQTAISSSNIRARVAWPQWEKKLWQGQGMRISRMRWQWSWFCIEG